MVGPSLRFDEKLFDLKMAELLPQVYGLAVDDTPLREALTIQEGSEEAPRGAYEVQLIDRYFVRLREQLQGIDRIAREVWQIQGEAVTPEFVREILFPKAMGAIDAWLKTHTHTSVARDTKDPYPARFRQVAVLEVPKLRREVNARYEIEVRTLEHRNAATKGGVPVEQKKPKQGSRAEEGDDWQAFHGKFMQLAMEEEANPRAIREDRLLRAYCDYKKHNAPETGLWTISQGLSENFQERFHALAARAGVALSCPNGTDPEDFWLHRLYFDLLENKSDQLFAASREGGVIRRVCLASATFCARLERKALEQSESGNGTENARLSSRPQNSASSAPNVENKNRRAMVDAYIEEVRSKKKKRITRKDIWSEAGYQTRTEFERWERRDPKHANRSADEYFTRILREKPHLK
jgi:hypothetical protein